MDFLSFRAARTMLPRLLMCCATAACDPGDGEVPQTARVEKTAVEQPEAVTESGQQSPLLAQADGGRTLGKATAGTWLLMVSDFQCPWCKMWHDSTFPAIKRAYVDSGKLRVAYINFPLGIHANAWPSALAAMCASAQGKFWETHDRIFQTQKVWEKLAKPEAYLDSLAIAAGANATRQHDCTANRSVISLVQADQARATQTGASTTPTFFIGGARIEGAEKFPLFRHVIDSVLAAAAKAK